MKTWLTKWSISSALDERQPLPPALAAKLEQSEELRQFVAEAHKLELALKNSRPRPSSSETLHTGIMLAIQRAEPVRAFAWPWPEFRSRLVPATAVLLLLLLLSAFGVTHFARRSEVATRPAGLPTLAVAGAAVELSDQFVRVLPDAALSPLNNERQSLNRDLAGAQAFLLASLP